MDTAQAATDLQYKARASHAPIGTTYMGVKNHFISVYNRY